jgi:L-threonylcarbamoyladenylate synthase
MFYIDDIDSIANTLHKGGIILYPTDTIWGLGCDATNARSVEKIYKIKKRSIDRPFILLVSDIEMLRKYVPKIHPRLETLLAFHERPLTVIYQKVRNLPKIVRGAGDTVAIRITLDEFCRQMISKLGRPVVATSANISDHPYPAHFGDISSEIINQVNYVVKYRQDRKNTGEPSQIVKLSPKAELIFLRE